jgi:hypothetical protein
MRMDVFMKIMIIILVELMIITVIFKINSGGEITKCK